MPTSKLDNLNIVSRSLLPTPRQVRDAVPITEKAAETVIAGRKTLQAILERRDPRLILVVGACSIHNLETTREYAQRLKELASTVVDTVAIVMRVYFEKPRTTMGWKG